MLAHCGWVEKHQITLDSNGWVEEHDIQTMDTKQRGFEIKFVIDMVNSYIEVIGISMIRPRVDNYQFYIENLHR